MIKKNLALTVLANVDLLTKVTMTLSPVDIARLMLISCNQLRAIPALDLILKHQLTSTTPYHHQELLLYDSFMKAHSDTIEECDSILKKAHLNLRDLLRRDEHLSSDEQKKLIRLYHLSSSPFSKPDHSELANNIQSYINDNLPDENDTLFGMIIEAHKGKKEKDRHKKDITQMIIEHPLLVFAKDKDDNTTLHRAARRGHKDTVELLIEKGADVNVNNRYDYTPLHGAASRGRSAEVTLLLANRADVNAINNRGFTPLHEAAFRKDPSVVQALLDAGSNKEAINADGNTPLRIAQSQGHQNIVRLLQKGEQKTQNPDCCILM